MMTADLTFKPGKGKTLIFKKQLLIYKMNLKIQKL